MVLRTRPDRSERKTRGKQTPIISNHHHCPRRAAQLSDAQKRVAHTNPPGVKSTQIPPCPLFHQQSRFKLWCNERSSNSKTLRQVDLDGLRAPLRPESIEIRSLASALQLGLLNRIFRDFYKLVKFQWVPNLMNVLRR